MESLRVGEEDITPLARTTTLDNLATVELELSRRAGPLWLSDDYATEPTARHLRRAEYYYGEAIKIFESLQPGSPKTS